VDNTSSNRPVQRALEECVMSIDVLSLSIKWLERRIGWRLRAERAEARVRELERELAAHKAVLNEVCNHAARLRASNPGWRWWS
jgi:hypothetical protein